MLIHRVNRVSRVSTAVGGVCRVRHKVSRVRYKVRLTVKILVSIPQYPTNPTIWM